MTTLKTATRSVNPADRFILWIAGFFGPKAKEVERFLKFALVGTFGAVVDFATLNVLQFVILVPVPPYQNTKIASATGIAFCTAVLSNFVLNRYWTYPDSRSRSMRRQLAQFFLISIVGLVFRLIFVSVSYKYLGDFSANLLESLSVNADWGEEAIFQLGTNEAQAISIVVVLFWNFFANRYWTYNDVE